MIKHDTADIRLWEWDNISRHCWRSRSLNTVIAARSHWNGLTRPYWQAGPGNSMGRHHHEYTRRCGLPGVPVWVWHNFSPFAWWVFLQEELVKLVIVHFRRKIPNKNGELRAGMGTEEIHHYHHHHLILDPHLPIPPEDKTPLQTKVGIFKHYVHIVQLTPPLLTRQGKPKYILCFMLHNSSDLGNSNINGFQQKRRIWTLHEQKICIHGTGSDHNIQPFEDYTGRHLIHTLDKRFTCTQIHQQQHRYSPWFWPLPICCIVQLKFSWLHKGRERRCSAVFRGGTAVLWLYI